MFLWPQVQVHFSSLSPVRASSSGFLNILFCQQFLLMLICIYPNFLLIKNLRSILQLNGHSIDINCFVINLELIWVGVVDDLIYNEYLTVWFFLWCRFCVISSFWTWVSFEVEDCWLLYYEEAMAWYVRSCYYVSPYPFFLL